MNDSFRRKIEMMARGRDFGATYKSAFEANSRAARLFDDLGTIIAELRDKSSNQASAFTSSRGVTTSRTLAREVLLEEMESIQLTARALGVTRPGLEDKFRITRSSSDQALLATARAFAKDAAPLKAEFIALEMPPDFLEHLQAAIDGLEAALTDKHSAQRSKAVASTSMENLLEQGMSTITQLHAVVNNKFRGDEAVLVAWKRATHLERAHHTSRAPAAPVTDGGEGEGKNLIEPPGGSPAGA